MRIIAGEFRGRKLLPPEDAVTRPVTDRVKQSLFDILAPRIEGARVYDCFAGTGSMGLESLSRGAAYVTFFEAHRPALQRLKKNIAALGVADRSTLVPGDLFQWFAVTKPLVGADLVFLDPPYRFLSERAEEVRRLAGVLADSHLRPEGVVVFRHDAQTALALARLEVFDRREYGGMVLEFLHAVEGTARGGNVTAMADEAPPSPNVRSDREDALAVVRRLREAGHVAYFAGGCVRDQLLGLTPKDYDVATDAPPNRVRELFTRTDAVGAAFGVILVRQRRGQIEVATFRTDLAYRDGRRPEGVRFATAEEDARRRDFTINGLFLDPVENRLIDYVGGQEDLKGKVLRAIGNPDERFTEDHLRLLRAIRFAARFDLSIEPSTADAIRRHADHLKRISPERVADEMRVMLVPPTRVAAWKMLWGFGLLSVILRTLPERPIGPEPSDQYSGPLFPELAPGEPVPFPLALAALVLCYRRAERPDPKSVLLELPEVKKEVHACRTTLKISNDESDFMTGVLHLGPLLRDGTPTVATMKRFLATPIARWARVLLDAMNRTAPSTRIEWLQGQFARLEREDVAPAPLVTGDDLTAAGLAPGPLFKRVLDAVYDAQLEGRFDGKQEALAMALALAHGS